MLKDFRIFRWNSGKNPHPEGNENSQGKPTTDLSLNPTAADSMRPPLNTIQDPWQNPKPETDQESAHRDKIERTPSKIRAKGPYATLPFRTPEKPGAGPPRPKNRFGWDQKNDSSFNSVETREDVNHLLPVSRGTSLEIEVSRA